MQSMSVWNGFLKGRYLLPILKVGQGQDIKRNGKRSRDNNTVKGCMDQAYYPSLVPMRMPRAEREKASPLSP